MSPETQRYNQDRAPEYAALCDALAVAIDHALPAAENKLWHAHPVWFLAGNPIVGYSEQKPGIRLMFWSGADFDEPQLNVLGRKFKDASIFYNDVEEIDEPALERWLSKAVRIQWDYQNLVRRKGRLLRVGDESID